MGSMSIEPLESTLGAVVTGVRLAALSDAEWPAIEDAFNDHALLVFPAQHLDEVEQVAFGRRFGRLEPALGVEGGVLPITNLKRDGVRLREAGDPTLDMLKGNEGWHTDSSFKEVSAKASGLSAHIVPSAGGETEWADMRAAYDALPEAFKSWVATLSAHHSYGYSQAKVTAANAGSTAGADGYEAAGGAPLRPLVKVHPATDRPALFIGRHAYAIRGLTDENSEHLLAALLEDACQSPRILTHSWSVGDAVVWDNRCVLHRVRPWDMTEARLMAHTRISGDPVTEGLPA